MVYKRQLSCDKKGKIDQYAHNAESDFLNVLLQSRAVCFHIAL